MSRRRGAEFPELTRVRETRAKNQRSMSEGLAKLSPSLKPEAPLTPEPSLFAPSLSPIKLNFNIDSSVFTKALEEAHKQTMSKWTWSFTPAEPSIDSSKLEALKAATPYRVEMRVPDYVSVITAWRSWRVVNKEGWRLQALGKSHVWQPKEAMDAICSGDVDKHPAPQRDCNCGVWAFKELDSLVEAVSTYQGVAVIGKVSLWGRVIETENGYRAQHAYPEELWLLDSSMEELGLIYDVPVRTVQASIRVDGNGI